MAVLTMPLSPQQRESPSWQPFATEATARSIFRQFQPAPALWAEPGELLAPHKPDRERDRYCEHHEEHEDQLRGVHRPIMGSEEHTSELQSPCNLVCRLLLEKKT